MQRHLYIFNVKALAICNHTFTLHTIKKKSPPLSHRQHHSPTHSGTSLPAVPMVSAVTGQSEAGRQGLGGLECLRGGTAAGLQRVNRTLGDGGMEEEG